MSDNTKIAIFTIVILLMLYSKKLTEVVTAKVGGVPVTNPNLGVKDFDYSVCGISPDVARGNLPIRVCTDPITGKLYPIEEYPNGGNSAQIVFLRDQAQADENLRLNTPSTTRTYGPFAPGLLSTIVDSIESNQLPI